MRVQRDCGGTWLAGLGSPLRSLGGQIVTACSGLALSIATAACVSAEKVHINTPAYATLDVSPFRRVLVAGFVSGGTTELDANRETVRLLRTQLRVKTSLTVIDTDVDVPTRPNCAKASKREKDLEACEDLFADTALWKQLGREYQDALIVTGTLFFTAHPRGGSLTGTFVFIDSRTGRMLHAERVREQTSSHNRRAALSSYFLLMDRVVPVLLRVVSDQPRPGSRTLLR